MIREVMVSRLKEYFLSRGVELLFPEELKLDNNVADFFDLFLKDGNNLIAVKVYSPGEKLATHIKKELEILAVEVLKLKHFIDKAYIAVPEEIGLLKIPQEIFESAGIGVLIVSEKEIEERIPARAFKKLLRSVDEALKKEIQEFSEEITKFSIKIEKEIEKIKNELSILNKRMDFLYKDLNTLKREVEQLKNLQGKVVVEMKPVEAREETPVEGIEGLPDFISDNPWVSILVKRGREDGS
ncbi:MAG: hypothetical protein DRJ37_02185 [Thermoprotei archaeon]|nr:MAG: hypothetical protein DRJ37_02185 [Thermoprotei archaeon]